MNIGKLSLRKAFSLPLLALVLTFVSSVGVAPKAAAAGSSAGFYSTVYMNCRSGSDYVTINGVKQNSPYLNKSFRPGQFCMFSKDTRWFVTFQSDGNLVVYPPNITARPWATGTNGKGATRLTLQTDGNMVIYKDLPGGGYQVLWATNVYGPRVWNSLNKLTMVMQNDGNLVIYQKGPYIFGPPVWSRW